MKLTLSGKVMSGPGFRTVVTRYISLKHGSFELRLEWTTRAAIKMRKEAEVYFGLKVRAERCLDWIAYEELTVDLDEHWASQTSTHTSASALILERLKEHQCVSTKALAGSASSHS